MIDIRKLKELVRLMVENDLTELDLKDQEETVTVKRGGSVVMQAPPAVYTAAPRSPALAGAAEAGEAEPPREADDESGLVAVSSPMVGTLYLSPSPDAAPFIASGATVGPDTVVCLIEAMKVFNEIKAEVAGTVERILVGNGEAVEFGQKIFLVRPA